MNTHWLAFFCGVLLGSIITGTVLCWWVVRKVNKLVATWRWS